MYRGYLRYFAGFFVTIVLIVILIVLLFGSGSKGNKQTAPKTPRSLASLASTDTQVQMLIIGFVNANQDHQQVRVTVDRDSATFDLLNGYQSDVASSKTYANNETAYSDFLHALALAGYTSGDNSKGLANYEGVCPLGTRYVFRIIESGKTTSQYWATSCNKIHTYLGATNLTISLFQAQIPDYDTLSDGANIR